jgi:hypothetical protein
MIIHIVKIIKMKYLAIFLLVIFAFAIPAQCYAGTYEQGLIDQAQASPGRRLRVIVSVIQVLKEQERMKLLEEAMQLADHDGTIPHKIYGSYAFVANLSSTCIGVIISDKHYLVYVDRGNPLQEAQ